MFNAAFVEANMDWVSSNVVPLTFPQESHVVQELDWYKEHPLVKASSIAKPSMLGVRRSQLQVSNAERNEHSTNTPVPANKIRKLDVSAPEQGTPSSSTYGSQASTPGSSFRPQQMRSVGNSGDQHHTTPFLLGHPLSTQNQHMPRQFPAERQLQFLGNSYVRQQSRQPTWPEEYPSAVTWTANPDAPPSESYGRGLERSWGPISPRQMSCDASTAPRAYWVHGAAGMEGGEGYCNSAASGGGEGHMVASDHMSFQGGMTAAHGPRSFSQLNDMSQRGEHGGE